MHTASEEKLCARLDACLGATLHKMWEAFGSVLHQHTGEGAELLFLLVLSVLFGATNAAQVHQLLGLKGQPLYKKINALTPQRWKRLLQQVCFQAASAQLEVLGSQSPAAWSRACAVIALDDTLVRRLGKKLGLVWTWWEGMSHKVARGQNVIALVLVIGDRVIPLDVRIASKQGRIKLTKPVLAERMLLDWEAQWKRRGLSLGSVKLVANSWYPSKDLLALRRELELEVLTEGKASYSFTVEGEKVKAADGTKRRYVMATGLHRRAHEVLRAYSQRAQILTRRLHRYPAFRKVTMEHTIRLCQRFSSILDWIKEHFHHVAIQKPNIVNYLKSV